jgi:hypothetical protein
LQLRCLGTARHRIVDTSDICWCASHCCGTDGGNIGKPQALKGLGVK